jgi:hypothetical protein
MSELGASSENFARGAATGLLMPATPDALVAAGPAFLTAAFRAYGVLPDDNAVVRIAEADVFAGGNSGLKLQLTVDYARSEPTLERALFVKFSRDLTDPFRDRRRFELEAEVRLAHLSRHPAFPVPVATPYFADFDPASGTGMLITSRIAFGTFDETRGGMIEPMRTKCLDHDLPERMEYYRATMIALARLTAAHKAGRLSPQLEELFPFDRAAAEAELPIQGTPADVETKARAIAAMIEQAPQIFPPEVSAADFLHRFPAEARRFAEHEAAVKRFLYADANYVALAHWNSNIDNAWFWRGADGVLHCGLLDWGMVRQMNLGISLWGGLSAASPDLWDGGLEPLLALFTQECAARGGPALDPERLGLHFNLSAAMMGLALMLDAPTLVAARLPAFAQAKSRLDPALRADQVGHGFLHVFTAFLELWARRDFGAALNHVLEEAR